MGRVKDWGTRKDANHNKIRQRFIDLLCRVKDVHMVPGFVDLIVKCSGKMRLVEIKDGDKVKSQRKLTDMESDFWEYWGETPTIVESVDDVERLVSEIRRASR